MSTEKHTPGPWRIRTDLPQPVIASESGQYVVAIPSEVNAARIVACVNAMEGIEDPAQAVIERSAYLSEVEALIFVQKEALKAVKTYLGKTGITTDNADLWNLVNTALK